MQKGGAELVRTRKNVCTLSDVLRNNRPGSKYHERFIHAKELYSSLGFEPHAPRTAERSVYRWASVGSENVEDYFRVNIYYSVVDTITSDLELRSGEQHKCASNVNVLIPTIRLISGNHWRVSFRRMRRFFPIRLLSSRANLAIYGCSQQSMRRSSSHLSERKQLVLFKGKLSEQSEITTGVPQRSILDHSSLLCL